MLQKSVFYVDGDIMRPRSIESCLRDMDERVAKDIWSPHKEWRMLKWLVFKFGFVIKCRAKGEGENVPRE